MAKKSVYDPNTKTFITAEAAKEAKGGYVRLSLSEGLADQLIACADEDGIDRDADTEMGKKVRTSNVLRQYVEAAVQDFLNARALIASED